MDHADSSSSHFETELRLVKPSRQRLPEATDLMKPSPMPNWSEILDTIRQLQPTDAMLEQFRHRISIARDEFQRAPVSADEVSSKDFQKVTDLVSRLVPIVERISAEIPDGEGLRNELAALAFLQSYSRKRSGDTRFRNRKSRVMFHFEVLRAWVALGGKLGLSSNPVAGTVTGPLARYFSAVTGGVTNASLHSLRDAIQQHDEILKELEDLVK